MRGPGHRRTPAHPGITATAMARARRRGRNPAPPAVTRATLALAPWLEQTGNARLLAELLTAGSGAPATGAERAEQALWSAIARAALGDAAAAATEARRALTLARRHRARRIEARALSMVGMHEREAGRARAAKSKLQRALALARAIRDRELEAETANRLALVCWDLGDPDARQLLESALRLARRAGLPQLEGRIVGNLAAMALSAGDEASFVRYTNAAVARFRRLGNRRHEGYGRFNLAAFLSARGDLGDARQQYVESLAAAEDTHDRKLTAMVIGHLGMLEQRQDGPGAGGAQLERAVALMAGTDAWQAEALLTAALAAERSARGRVEDAAALLDHAEQLLAGRTGARVLELFRVSRGHLELAQARRAAAGGDTAAAERYRAAVRHRLAAAETPAAAPADGDHAAALVLDPADLDFAVRLLRQAFEHEAPSSIAPDGTPDHALVVDPTGVWFRPPGGAIVDLSRRRPLMRIVVALAERRRSAEAPLTLAELVAAGWPGERILPEAAQVRVHVAISTLRTLGLRGLLLHGKAGYFLDRGVPFVDGYRVTTVVGAP